jgi:hypothetical protein
MYVLMEIWNFSDEEAHGSWKKRFGLIQLDFGGLALPSPTQQLE